MTQQMEEKIEETQDPRINAKLLFQFVSRENGKRSAPFISNWDEVIQILETSEEGQGPDDDDYVLLVAVLEGQETKIPSTPLITVKTLRGFAPNTTTEENQDA